MLLKNGTISDCEAKQRHKSALSSRKSGFPKGRFAAENINRNVILRADDSESESSENGCSDRPIRVPRREENGVSVTYIFCFICFMKQTSASLVFPIMVPRSKCF